MGQYPALDKYLAACKKYRWAWNIRRPDWWSRWVFLGLYIYTYFLVGIGTALLLLPVGFLVEYLLAAARMRTFSLQKMMAAQAEENGPESLLRAMKAPRKGRSLDPAMLRLLDDCAADCYRIGALTVESMLYGVRVDASTRTALRQAATVSDKSIRRLISIAFRQYVGLPTGERQVSECEDARSNIHELADLCEESVRIEATRVDNEAISNSIAHLKAITELQESTRFFPRA